MTEPSREPLSTPLLGEAPTIVKLVPYDTKDWDMPLALESEVGKEEVSFTSQTPLLIPSDNADDELKCLGSADGTAASASMSVLEACGPVSQGNMSTTSALLQHDRASGVELLWKLKIHKKCQSGHFFRRVSGQSSLPFSCGTCGCGENKSIRLLSEIKSTSAEILVNDSVGIVLKEPEDSNSDSGEVLIQFDGTDKPQSISMYDFRRECLCSIWRFECIPCGISMCEQCHNTENARVEVLTSFTWSQDAKIVTFKHGMVGKLISYDGKEGGGALVQLEANSMKGPQEIHRIPKSHFDKVQFLWSKTHQEFVPTWAYIVPNYKPFSNFDGQVLDAEDRLTASSFPAWRPLFMANIALWSFAIVFPVVVFFASKCQGPGLAKGPPWLWAFFVPPFVLALYCDMAAHKHVVWQHVQALGAFTVLGRVVPFKLWYAMVVCLSMAAHADLATNTFFFGRILATQFCEESEVPRIWSIVVARSTVPFLPSFMGMGCIVWMLLFTQLANSLGFASVKNHEMRQCLFDGKPEKFGEKFNIHNLKCIDTMYGGVSVIDQAEALADSSRSTLYAFRSVSYTNFALADTASLYGDCRSNIANKVSRLALKTMTNLCLESALQPNLQVTALALQIAATGKGDTTLMFSLVLSYVMTVNNLFKTWSNIRMMVDLVEPYLDENDDERPRLRKSVLAFKAFAAVCIAGTAYAFAKTVATSQCSYGVWNINGCVDLSNITQSAVS